MYNRDIFAEIAGGPSAGLYESLMQHKRFTREQIILGVVPLFFGKKFSREIACAYLNGEIEEFLLAGKIGTEVKGRDLLEVEKGRIAEIERGEFRLPQCAGDLVEYADGLVAEYQEAKKMLENAGELLSDDMRLYPDGFYRPAITALEEVKGIIAELRDEGLL